MKALDFLQGELEELERATLRRHRPRGARAGLVALCSNDYLGYAGRRARAHRGEAMVGAGASRLIAGDHAAHRALEELLSGWLGYDDALVFSSGYAANVGLLSALCRPADVIVSDALCHASIIDGCRLSRAEVRVVPHGDVEATRRELVAARQRRPEARLFVVTEGYFSMDGDTPDLRGLRRVCDEAGAALLVDDAHALGVLGPEGRGACAEAGVVADALVGTFGKALGAQGAFVAGSRLLTDWLWNRARSFVFSTGLSPLVAEAAAANVQRARGDDEGRAIVHRHAQKVRGALSAAGLVVPASSRGPIIPVLLGSEARALAMSASLLERGVQVSAIRPPTVPRGGARLRVTVSAGLDDGEVERACEAFGWVASGRG